MGERKGNWMQTFSGLRFWVMDPSPDEVRIEDIAHALSMQCRYNGHCSTFYSVAQHSVLVSHVLEREHPPVVQFWGLIHDAAEAYLGDMVRPLKRSMPAYREAEDRVMLAVVQRMGLQGFSEPPAVKWADTVLLSTERRDLMCHKLDWNQEELCPPMPARIIPEPPEDAEEGFLLRFRALQARVLDQHGIGIYPEVSRG